MKVLVTEKLSPHKYKTPEGYLICVDAVLARTGKQSYMRSELFDTDDETEVDVDRRPEEVFSPQTLASFENKPITVEHPNEDVNSENFKEYAVGFVRDVHQGQVDGQPVILGTLVIQDAKTIEEIENGQHTDLSCGYDCDIDDVENPQQRNIRGNHVALCECGRAGNARIVDSYNGYYDEKEKDNWNNGYAYYFEDDNDYYRALKQVKASGQKILATGVEAGPNGRQYFVLKDSIKDSKYIVHFKHKNGGGDKDIIVEAKGMREAVEIAKTYVSDFYYKYVNVKPYFEDSVKDSIKDYQSTKESFDRIEEMPRTARKWVGETSNKKAGLLTIENGIEDIINSADPSIREELRRRGDKILRDIKIQFRIEDEESTYTEVTKELEKNYDNFAKDSIKDSKLTLDQIVNIYKILKKNK